MNRSRLSGLFRLFCLSLLAIFLLTSSGAQAADSGANPPPSFLWPIGAPWPAGVTLHNVNGSEYHTGANAKALDFNGSWDELKDYDPPGTKEQPDQYLLVTAIADGCVKKVEKLDEKGESKSGYGYSVVLSHAGGFESRYAHFESEPLVSTEPWNDEKKCGPFVAQGQALGQIGSTGTSTAPHLHFAIHYCDPSKKNCSIQSVIPEPMDGAKGFNKKTQVTSKNYGVGYEEIKKTQLWNPGLLDFHRPIFNEYRDFGGQYSLFGRSTMYVKPFKDTPFFYQEFEPRALMSIFSTAILENGDQAYMMPGPIWSEYVANYTQFGSPNSHMYLTRLEDGDYGWRIDFRNASLFWNWGLSKPIVWDESNAPWQASFCPTANQFSCAPVRRWDPYIDFEFADSNNTGPLRGSQGFSAIWEADLDGKLLSKYSLGFELQGHARFYIDGKAQGDYIHAEDAPISGVTQPTWHVNQNHFVIRLWQAPGKPARLRVVIREQGIVPLANAFETEGVLDSHAYEPPPVAYADFEPPPLVGEGDTPPAPPPEEPPVEPPIVPPGLEGWWNTLVERIRQIIQGWLEEWGDQLAQELEDWWQENQDRLLAELQKAVIDALLKLMQSLEQQCLGSLALPAGLVALGWGLSRHRRR